MLITDLFGKASIDTGYAIATTVKTTRTAGVTVLEAYDLSKFSDDTPVFFITYKKTTDPVTSEVTVSDLVSYKALVNTGANTLTNLTIAPGYTDIGNDVGDFVECIPTSYWVNSLIDGISVSIDPADGTLKAGAVDVAAVLANGVVEKAKLETTVQTAIYDGWVTPAETWTYASAQTFTVPGDQTAKYTKGTRLKWTQTTVKYGVVISSAYTSSTTVTIATNTDYTIANAAITANYYSYASNPQGYPSRFAYTTTVTAPSGTAPTYSTNTGYFSLNNGTVNATAVLVNTSGGTAGAGAVVMFVTKPIVTTDTSGLYGVFKSYENGGTISPGFLTNNDATTCYLSNYNMSANVLAQDQSSADRYIQLNFSYLI